jgi:hypothetical protein
MQQLVDRELGVDVARVQVVERFLLREALGGLGEAEGAARELHQVLGVALVHDREIGREAGGGAELAEQAMPDRLEERFDGSPTLLILDEARVFLDNPLFAARIREWLKILRKKNVGVVFATQSLADIADSTIAPALIESCPQRIFLPNDRALEPQSRAAYERFGLNERQLGLVSSAIPKRDYYLQSRRGNRLFDLGLGRIALAFCGASGTESQRRIDRILAEEGGGDFARRFLQSNGLDWASALLGEFPTSNEGDDG